MRIIHTSRDERFRITEHVDYHADMEDLKGDVYNAKVNPDIDVDELRAQEKAFEELVQREGVFGYVLERWNPEPDKGWEHVDSCWGFVGSYTPTEETFNHYIVDELKAQIPVNSELEAE